MHDNHLLDNFYVITVISNPVRFKSRYALYEKFAEKMKQAGVKLMTVEVAFGDRTFKVTDSSNPMHIQLQTNEEIWHKENMINLGISRLPATWEYVAWIDADVEFIRPDWALETVHQLQHYQVVQMFQTAIDMGPTGEAFNTYNGFGWSYITRQPYPKGNKYYPYWHPGYAWAARKEAINGLGGLIDFAVLGSADHHMATALIGKADFSYPTGIHPNYIKLVNLWQENADKYINKNIGFVPGTLMHHWHGKKKDRKYWDRWDILKKHQFDPLTDLKRDWQGLLQLRDRDPGLRDDIRAYFRNRNEDSIDVE